MNDELIKEKMIQAGMIEEEQTKSEQIKDKLAKITSIKIKPMKTSSTETSQAKISPTKIDWIREHLTKENLIKNRFQIMQIAAVIVLMIFIGYLLYDDVPDNVSLSTIETALEKTDVFPGDMQAADSIRIRRLYGINVNDYSEVLSYIPESSMDVDELLIVRVSDSSQIAAVKAAMEARLSSQKTSFDGYGTNQTELLNDAEIEDRGNYIWFAVGKDHKIWTKTIQEELH